MTAQFNLDFLTNTPGIVLSNSAIEKIRRYFHKPTKDNWNDIYGYSLGGITLWQAILKVSPFFPRYGRKTDENNNILEDWFTTPLFPEIKDAFEYASHMKQIEDQEPPIPLFVRPNSPMAILIQNIHEAALRNGYRFDRWQNTRGTSYVVTFAIYKAPNKVNTTADLPSDAMTVKLDNKEGSSYNCKAYQPLALLYGQFLKFLSKGDKKA